MKSWLIVLISWIFMIGHVAAQSSECGFFVISQDDNHNLHFTVYAPSEEGYQATSTLALPRRLMFSTQLQSGEVQVILEKVIGFTDFEADFWRISRSQFTYLGRMPVRTLTVSPRRDPWSHDGRYVLMRNTMDNQNHLFYVFDTELDTYFEPTTLNSVFNVSWSPTRNIFAFLAYDRIWDGGTGTVTMRDYAVYITDPERTFVVEIPADPEDFAYFQWLNGDELVVVSCPDDNCNTMIYNVADETTETLELGNYILSDYIESLDSYVLSRLGDRNVFLMDSDGELTQMSDVDHVVSRPLVSWDERYIVYRAYVGDYYQQVMVDLLNEIDAQVIKLNGDRPEILISNRGENRFSENSPYCAMGSWHPIHNLFLYDDGDEIFIYDSQTSTSTPVLQDIDKDHWGASWLCSHE